MALNWTACAWGLVLGAGWAVAAGGAAEEGAPSCVPSQAVAELEVLLDSRATPEALAEVARWMMRHNEAFTLSLPSDTKTEPIYSHPILERLHRSCRSLSWGQASSRLSPEERFRIFCMQKQRALRLGPVDFFPSSALLSDDLLIHAMTYLVENPHGARYDGMAGVIRYTDPQLAKAPEFLWRFLQENPSGFARTVTGIREQPLYARLMMDTFNELPRSQIEPYDHLYGCLRTALTTALGQINRQPYVTRAAFNRFCRQYTDRVFGYPENRTSAPLVAFGHNGDIETRSFDFLCAGHHDRIRLGEKSATSTDIHWIRGDGQSGPTNSRRVERILKIPVFGFHIVYGAFDLRPGVDKADVELLLRCATGVYSATFDVEKGDGSLPAPSNRLRLDQARARGELNVVSSFALFSAPDGTPSTIAMGRLAQIGMLPVSAPTVVPDLWLDFQMEVARPNTALVVPIYHMVDQERCRLGWNGARKMEFAKTMKGADGPGAIRRVRAVLYMPPADPNAEEVLLHRSEFGQLFRTRDVSPIQEDTLSLINMSCFSQYTVESWMAAFREAVRDRDPADVDPADIPFVIGSRRGFDAVDPFSLLEAPDLMIRGLCEGRTRSELLTEMNALGYFVPLTNLDRPELLRMGGSFRLQVTRVGSPEETASF